MTLIKELLAPPPLPKLNQDNISDCSDPEETETKGVDATIQEVDGESDDDPLQDLDNEILEAEALHAKSKKAKEIAKGDQIKKDFKQLESTKTT